MLEPQVVGYWTEKHLHPGDMESADIAFRSDGTGWVYWCNAAAAFEVLRFTWHTTEASGLVIDINEYASGTWHPDSPNVAHITREQASRNDHLTLAYAVTDGSDASGKPATVLTFDQPVIHGLTGHRFSLERQLADNERDPGRAP